MLQSSGQEIEGILKGQGDKGMAVFAEEDEFNKDAVPAVITSFDKTGKEIEAKPYGEPSITADQIAAEGFGAQLDKTDAEITEEELNKILGKYSPPDIKSSTDDGAGGEGEGEGTAEEFPDPTGGFATRGQPRTPDIEVPKSKPPELVTEIFKTGNDEQKSNTIDDMIKQFTDRAPEYEGLNKGLALAKIGFAMAAGDSPDALTNIAKALHDGADMLIEDEKERNAYKRQIDLSALQYGLTETAKIAAEKRQEANTFTDFVDENDKIVRVSVADYKANNNKLPEGLISMKMYTSNQTAINEKAKLFAKVAADAKEAKTLPWETQRKLSSDYAENVALASEAETAGTLIETVIQNSGDVVGAWPEVKQVGAQFFTFFGYTPPEGWDNKKLNINQLKAALQSVVKTTLGATQSANSISNRDVELLIEGFLAEGVISYDKDTGIVDMSTTMVSRKQFVNSLQKGLNAVRRAQAGALNKMTNIEIQLYGAYTATGYDAMALIEPLRTGLVMPGSVGKKGFQPLTAGATIGGLKLGNDGIWDKV